MKFTSAQPLSCVQLFVTPWIVACQAPLSMEFPRQKHSSVAISFSRETSPPGVRSYITCVGRQILYYCASIIYILTLTLTLTPNPNPNPNPNPKYWTWTKHLRSNNCYYCEE